MAILKIARMGHPVLSGISEPVEDPTDPEIGQLIADMAETMRDAQGIGLAAPQVHVAKRIVVFHVPESRDPDGGGMPMTVLINPGYDVLSEELESGWEGCLSVPGMRGIVSRPSRIRYRGHDEFGEAIERDAQDFHARVFQHEFDHLNGVLYPDKLEDPLSFGFTEELQALEES